MGGSGEAALLGVGLDLGEGDDEAGLDGVGLLDLGELRAELLLDAVGDLTVADMVTKAGAMWTGFNPNLSNDSECSGCSGAAQRCPKAMALR